MKAFTFVGFTLVLLALAGLAFNQQQMNMRFHRLAAEQQRLWATMEQQRQMAQTFPPGNPRPNRPIPGHPMVPDTRSRSGMPRSNSSSPLLSSHSPDGKLLERPWGPEQIVGPANTMQAGDQTSAWAQFTSQGDDSEWLHVTFEKSVDIAEVIVRETYNPGAISKVAAILPSGQEVTIWEGTEPSVQAPVDMSFPVTQKVQANAVKVYLARSRVPGWNEIDAVELVGRDGSRQWAATATVSSAYSISPGNSGRNRFQEPMVEFDTLAPAVEFQSRDVLRR